METTTKQAENKNNAKKEKVERNPSTTYTIKSFKGVTDKLIKLKMVTKEEGETLKKLHRTVLERWIGLELGN